MTIPSVPAGDRNGQPASGGYVYRGTKRDEPDAYGLAARERQEAFGRAVQGAREALGLSRRQVSDAARIKPSRMGAIENGQDKPSATVLARIAEALGTTPEALQDPAAGPSPAAAEERPPVTPVTGAGHDPSLPASDRGSAGGGAKQPGPAVGREESAAGPGDQPEALSGKAFRDALKAANSAKAKGQRNQRARPWTKRDPYRKAVPGGRKPPPGGEQ